MSVIQSLTGGPPFGKPEDVEMGVSYASFFVMVYNVSPKAQHASATEYSS
jgi:hypothetical protein